MKKSDESPESPGKLEEEERKISHFGGGDVLKLHAPPLLYMLHSVVCKPGEQ